MNQSTKIFSNRCWVNGKLAPATITIEQGKITRIRLEREVDAIDVGSDVIMPGVIDAHVHVNEPGRTEWEGFETATKAAAAGGITSIVDMPLNASPVTTSLAALKEKLKSAQEKKHVNVGYYGGLIPGNLNELVPMMQAGVLGIKCFLVHSGIDEFPNVAEQDIDAAMPIIAAYGLPLLVHCEIDEQVAPCDLDGKPSSYAEYLASRPKQWENDAINMMIRLCRKHRCRVHIVHVSSAEALESIRLAKEEGLPISAETCAHYIYFNAEDIPDGNCLFKCAPPIREKANNSLLKKALQSGVLDFLATDHSPAPAEIKELLSGNLQKAWGGIAGLQYLLPAGWTALKDTLSLDTFIPLLTEKPARFLSIDDSKGKIAVGYDADIVIWSPEEKMQVCEPGIYHRHKACPYTGETMYGVVKKTIVNGRTVFSEGVFINETDHAGMNIINVK